MTLKHPAAISLAFVLITGPILMFAETTASSATDKEACILALKLTPELAETGSYKIRIDTCVRQREALRLSIDRNLRNKLRVEDVMERLTRNSRAINYRVVGTPETAAERQNRWNAMYRDNEAPIYSAPQNRPSRRAIQSDAEVSTKAWREVDGKVHQERLLRAMEACKQYSNNDYRRNACIRAELVNTQP
ncbi:hypothetical protein FJZ28_05415 [Candidatus Peregrinibacteria bacterium]|nr:hypothetical protein [Candidatus Peregrinibacteria bacterium]